MQDQEQTYFFERCPAFITKVIQPVRELPEGSFIVLCPVVGSKSR